VEGPAEEAKSRSKKSFCVEIVSERRREEEEECMRAMLGCEVLEGEAIMLEEDDAEVVGCKGVFVMGTGRGAARLVGLAKERKTAFALCLAVAEDDEAAAAGEDWCAASFSFGMGDSESSVDFLRLAGLGRAAASSESSMDLRAADLLPFLEAMVLAFALGGPQ
jgi:hypothetical protein